MPTPRRAFTLIESIVVIAILITVASLTIPAIQKVRAASDSLACKNQMRQIATAFHHYHTDYGRLPPSPAGGKGAPDNVMGWMALLLPYVEQDSLYRDCLNACAKPPNALTDMPFAGLPVVVRLYTCPSDARLAEPLTDHLGVTAAFASYVGVAAIVKPDRLRGYLGVLGLRPGCSWNQVTDGISNTILFGERPPRDSLQAGWWYSTYDAIGTGYQGPNNTLYIGTGQLTAGDPCVATSRAFSVGRTDNPCDRFHFWSLHPGGGHFAFCDLSVRYLPYSAEALVYDLCTRDGGEAIELP